VGLAVAGWAGASGFRRNLDIFAVSLCLLCAGLAVNAWIGYFPTVQIAFDQLASRPLPDHADHPTVAAMQRDGTPPAHGALVTVSTGTRSGFGHRDEYVYLPPAWFSSTPPPPLPALMMIGGQFHTPADWIRAGDAVNALDAFAAAHNGYAPVAAFVDANGTFVNDTECVNGVRGNAADHLTEDVLPYVTENFGLSRARWGVVGFSSGGTCALDLAVMHPDRFSTFLDIAGDIGPNAGTKAQTIERLYGGDSDAWDRFDPSTVITGHGRYVDISGHFVVPSTAIPGGAAYVHAATTLCELGKAHGIDCSVHDRPSRHTWPFAAETFAEQLPWLATRLCPPRSACPFAADATQ
jgi:S-formylglutathione hydrolase FrmB